MNRNHVSPLRFFSGLVLISGMVLTMLGCNQGGDATKPDGSTLTKADTPVFTDWVDLHVTFKENTSPEMRCMSIRAIRKILMDSILAMRNGKFPNFAPAITVTTNGFGDTLEYGIKARARTNTAPIKDTTCTCAHNCGVCALIQKYASVPPTGPGPGPYGRRVPGATISGADQPGGQLDGHSRGPGF